MADVSIGGAGKAPRSPSVATPVGVTGLRGAISGVTRIGARAGLVAIAAIGTLTLAILYGLSTSGTHRGAAVVSAQTPAILPTSGPLFENIPGANATPFPTQRVRQLGGPNDRGSAPAPQPANVRRGSRSRAPVLPDPASEPVLMRTTVPDVAPLPAQPAVRMPSQADIAAARNAQRDAQARQLAEQARHAGIMISTNATSSLRGVVSDATAGSAPMHSGTTDAALSAAGAPAVVATPAAGASAAPDAYSDPNVAAQRAKADFVAAQKSTTASDYQTTPRQAAISPYEVQAGSIIPAILITGINSDLPGTMIGQVSQNVYDSKSGRYLLVPAGSKLVGRYDSQVTGGQTRVLVAWNRIIFPDSSFIDINGMAGTDTAGYSGLTGKVDDHSGKLFRNAILFSLIGAGATLLQPRNLTALTPVGAMIAAPTVGQQVAGQVGQQIAQAAQQSTQRGLQQQPTIEVRPGYLFNIIVDRDLVLPGPYTDAR